MVFIYNFYIRNIVETDIPRIHFNFNVLGTLSTSENKETEVISALISNQSGTSLSANYPVQKTDGVMENTTQNSDTPVISNIGGNDANKELRYDEEMLVDSAEVFADGNVSSPVGSRNPQFFAGTEEGNQVGIRERRLVSSVPLCGTT